MGRLLDSVKNRAGQQQDTQTSGGSLLESVRNRAEGNVGTTDTGTTTVNDAQPKTQPQEEDDRSLLGRAYDATTGFLSETASNAASLVKPGGITPGDVAAEVPGVAKRGAVSFGETFAPAITNWFDVSGSIIGEGLAYAVDPNVRKQANAGHMDEVLPTLSSTSAPDYAKDVFAAGLEYALFKKLPSISKMKVGKRTGLGILEGVGFGVAEGLANDRSAEEMMESMPTYAALGGGINAVAPYLFPVLKSAVDDVPRNIKNMMRGVKEGVSPGTARNIGDDIANPNTVDESVQAFTPGERYKQYMEQQGYEPIVPDDELPVIDFGDGAPAKRINLPSISADTPPNAGPRRPVMERLAALSDNKRDEVIRETRKLSVADSRGPGLDWNTALETAMARHEAKAAESTEPLKLVPEERIGKAEPESPVEAETQRQAANRRVQQIQDDAIQPQQQRRTEVPQEQLPVGEGQEQASRLEGRMKNLLDDQFTAQRAQQEGVETYQRMNKDDQIRRAVEYVDNNEEEALRVLSGDEAPPQGLLTNSIGIALEQKASTEANANLAAKLASLRSTRAGQEISILTEAEPNNPISKINEVITARKERAARRIKGAKTTADVDKEVTNVKNQAKREVTTRRLKIEQAENLLNDITC